MIKINLLLMNIIFNDVQEDHGLIKECQCIHGPIFEEFFLTAHQARYNQTCGLHAYDKPNDK